MEGRTAGRRAVGGRDGARCISWVGRVNARAGGSSPAQRAERELQPTAATHLSPRPQSHHTPPRRRSPPPPAAPPHGPRPPPNRLRRARAKVVCAGGGGVGQDCWRARSHAVGRQCSPLPHTHVNATAPPRAPVTKRLRRRSTAPSSSHAASTSGGTGARLASRASIKPTLLPPACSSSSSSPVGMGGVGARQSQRQGTADWVAAAGEQRGATGEPAP